MMPYEAPERERETDREGQREPAGGLQLAAQKTAEAAASCVDIRVSKTNLRKLLS